MLHIPIFCNLLVFGPNRTFDDPGIYVHFAWITFSEHWLCSPLFLNECRRAPRVWEESARKEKSSEKDYDSCRHLVYLTSNSSKYILQFWQIHLAIWTNTAGLRGECEKIKKRWNDSCRHPVHISHLQKPNFHHGWKIDRIGNSFFSSFFAKSLKIYSSS